MVCERALYQFMCDVCTSGSNLLFISFDKLCYFLSCVFLMSKESLENLRGHRGFLFAEEEAKEREKSCQVNNE